MNEYIEQIIANASRIAAEHEKIVAECVGLINDTMLDTEVRWELLGIFEKNIAFAKYPNWINFAPYIDPDFNTGEWLNIGEGETVLFTHFVANLESQYDLPAENIQKLKIFILDNYVKKGHNGWQNY